MTTSPTDLPTFDTDPDAEPTDEHAGHNHEPVVIEIPYGVPAIFLQFRDATEVGFNLDLSTVGIVEDPAVVASLLRQCADSVEAGETARVAGEASNA